MATLVLSTIGTALGGPAGAAIGALIGQTIDQRILGGKGRGPRVGDLAVQTSRYGTQVPRVYGRMRVAGSVVWATDLVEGAATSGAKGQPDATYSYSVSIAVALSSRPAMSVERIWADGKLIRGVDGVFKVPTDFRYYDGGEDQVIDPLIGSVEGIANTPAYRGLALAVFENLDLVEFGNRVPFLTFELVADDAPPDLSEIIEDASDGWATCVLGQAVEGYAAYGASIRTAIAPLIECFGLELVDDGSRLGPPIAAGPVEITDGDLGNSPDDQPKARLDRRRNQMSNIPGTVRLGFYDPESDFEAGEVRASAGDETPGEVQVELPAVVSTGSASRICQQFLGRLWAGQEMLTVRLPPRFLGLEPGSRLNVEGLGRWTVERCSVEGFVIVAELRPSFDQAVISQDIQTTAMARRSAAMATKASGGTGVELAFFDIPDLLNRACDAPVLLLAASSASSEAWTGKTVEISFGGQSRMVRAARRKSVLGRAISALGQAEPWLLDRANAVDVQLIDPEQWLVSCDIDALVAGRNIAVLGREVIQFGRAEPLGAGRFRLSHLIRGCSGTDWAAGGHTAGELFALVEPHGLQPIELPTWAIGAIVRAEEVSRESNKSSAEIRLTGEAMRPASPIRLAARLTPAGDMAVSWVPRSRLGFAWVDESDAPIAEASEHFQLVIEGQRSAVEILTDQRTVLVPGSSVDAMGAGPAAIAVRQIGDWSASNPSTIAIELSESLAS